MSELTVDKAEVNETVTKKGNASWHRARFLDVKNKDPNYTYRWVRIDEENIQKKLDEGWGYVDGSKEKVGVTRPDGIDVGKSTDTLIKSRGSVLMKMPMDMKKARDKFHADEVKANIESLTQEASSNIRKDGGTPYGTLKIT